MSEFKKLFKLFNQERKDIFCEMPSKKLAQDFIEDYINFLFPVNLGRNMCEQESENLYELLKFKLKQLLLPVKKQLSHSIDEITTSFFQHTGTIYQKLIKDARAINEFDPAANSISEVIVAYPGFFAICVYRITHELYLLKVPILPRLMAEYAHSKTGIDINPGAQIGESFFIDHGTGIVIGETTEIHDRVKLYQGVTLGALSVEKSMAQTKRHPTIESDVIIYAGATILGGETIVGKHSIIGGNVWITQSIPPNSVVTNRAETRIKGKKSSGNPI